MTIKELKKQIRQLPDKQIGPLLAWLQEYDNGEVWDRQIEADIARLGPDEFVKRLRNGMTESADERRQAALRLLNGMRFTSDAHRKQILNDIGLLLGEPIENADRK